MTGPTGSGKTEGIINLFVDYNSFIITNRNTLKSVTSEHGAVIFDDINWSKIDTDTKIHLLDKLKQSDIKIIYQEAISSHYKNRYFK